MHTGTFACGWSSMYPRAQNTHDHTHSPTHTHLELVLSEAEGKAVNGNNEHDTRAASNLALRIDHRLKTEMARSTSRAKWKWEGNMKGERV